MSFPQPKVSGQGTVTPPPEADAEAGQEEVTDDRGDEH